MKKLKKARKNRNIVFITVLLIFVSILLYHIPRNLQYVYHATDSNGNPQKIRFHVVVEKYIFKDCILHIHAEIGGTKTENITITCTEADFQENKKYCQTGKKKVETGEELEYEISFTANFSVIEFKETDGKAYSYTVTKNKK